MRKDLLISRFSLFGVFVSDRRGTACYTLSDGQNNHNYYHCALTKICFPIAVAANISYDDRLLPRSRDVVSTPFSRNFGHYSLLTITQTNTVDSLEFARGARALLAYRNAVAARSSSLLSVSNQSTVHKFVTLEANFNRVSER